MRLDCTARLAHLDFLASAIARRPMEVLHSPDHEETWADQARVFLGSKPCELPEPWASPVAARRIQVVAQCALLSAGSLAPDLTRRLRGRRGAARRYLTLEGCRVLSEQARHLPPLPPIPSASDDGAVSNSARESLRLALSRVPVASAPSWFGNIRPSRSQAGASVSSGSKVGSRAPGDVEDEEDDDETQDAGAILRLAANPLSRGGAAARLLASLLGAKKRRRSGAGSGSAELDSVGGGSPRGHRGGVLEHRASVVTDRLPALAGGWLYPEWDDAAGRYRPDWCTVVEVDPAIGSTLVGAPAREDALRRSLAALVLGMRPVRRETDGTDLDTDALLRRRVDRRLGFGVREDVYIAHRRRRRELSVLVLLDLSSSGGQRALDGRSVHEHQRGAAAALVSTLEILGDSVACYGFQSHGPTAVRLHCLKSFDEPASAGLRRLDATRPEGFTRLGAALRHGATVLERQGGTERRLMVVLSDGFAYDHGYEDSYGEADSRRAISEALARGAGCLCLSIGGVAHPESLRRVFGSGAVAHAPNLRQIAPQMGPLFASALSRAAGVAVMRAAEAAA